MRKNTKLLDQMVKSLRKMNDMKLKWGFFDEEYDEPRGVEKVSEVAQLVEEGHPNGGLFPGTDTPARPFFKTSVESAENHREIRRAIKRLQRQVLQGKITPEEKMEALGKIVTDQLRESIKNFGGSIKQSTIDMREYRGNPGDDPLMETETLYEAVDYEVEEK